jgi:hypothetical protein
MAGAFRSHKGLPRPKDLYAGRNAVSDALAADDARDDKDAEGDVRPACRFFGRRTRHPSAWKLTRVRLPQLRGCC